MPLPQAPNQLEALRQMSKVVADTGELEKIKLYKPQDCTTNPSLIYKAASLPQYSRFLHDAVAEEARSGAHPTPALVADRLSVMLGAELLKIVPGRVSTEVAARLSYDEQPAIDKALHLMDLYAQRGVDPSRVYIKLASTWEGIRACEALQKQGVCCNMTLLFSFAQAAACADAGASLISPFVGRILDWYRTHEGRDFAPTEDPGVRSVKRIYSYYKRHGYPTTVMAASFRSVDEIRELAGCDALTIGPSLLQDLETATGPLDYGLWPGLGAGSQDEVVELGAGARAKFEELHRGDAMAVGKLREGIGGFAADQDKLEALIAAALRQ
jgi:transaldolase